MSCVTTFFISSCPKTVECASWLAYSDLLTHRINSDSDYSLGPYTPFPALAVHHHISKPRRVPLDNPSTYSFTIYQEGQRNSHLVRSFLCPTNQLTITGVEPRKVVLDFLPHLLDIIYPSSIRSTLNFSLLTPREKNDLSNLIDTMLSLSLTFRPEVQTAFTTHGSSHSTFNRQGVESNIIYKLEPPIDLLCEWTNPLEAHGIHRFEAKDKFGNPLSHNRNKFQQHGGTGGPVSTYIISTLRPTTGAERNLSGKLKQMIAREIEFENIKRAERRMAERGTEMEVEEGMGGANGSEKARGTNTPANPSLISPAVQRLLEEERRKRNRAADGDSSLTSPPKPVTGTATTTAADEEDESPATKKARTRDALNFLSRHADFAKNKQRNRLTRAAAAGGKGGKLDLQGLKTEKENQMNEMNTSSSEDRMDLTSSSSCSSSSSSVPTPAPGASILSRFTHSLHFKYNEGCTNAVRRTVHIAHFLPS